MKHVLGLCLGLLLSSQVMAFGETGRWSSSWGQGTSEYATVDAQHNQLYIACNETDSPMISLKVGNKEYGALPAKEFSLIVDGEVFDNIGNTGSRVGNQNFVRAWDKIRKAKSLEAKTADGKLIKLPLTGAAKVLPASRSKDFPCTGF
ncbi:hypothetical protein EAY64_05425 [Aquitalea palustris]|uniref:Uncharacterized protein n=1 Tax=Aquitalea palustris TaxID=2480983 RepID=A0A454JL85_9NEIS|nr:hypothetical protein [Aquitalea palustris]RMD00165.1 hypothetical protein EAY64_05425 [Aquitalea palustris]